ncbi:Qat anti-phage system QueC-like protein QatC [Viridibacillus sp. NPDC093762]|uniref:Qat anti-phage system QueC-like protein QatC n=1 Tax=Viridibacillus sp. NPDC093762 TaxID=3390720 RepID=UPI003D058A40
MVNVWINKNEEDFNRGNLPNEKFYFFNLLSEKNKSNVKTDIEQLWRRFGAKNLSGINEDFLIIATSIFCADKKISRKLSTDNWTRDIKLYIPVLEIEKWNLVKERLETTIGFLSGDKWSFEFRPTTSRFRADKEVKNNVLTPNKYDSVSLFSGGLDSFCGALSLSKNNNSTLFIGFREYTLLTKRQKDLFNAIDNSNSEVENELILFNVNPYAPTFSNEAMQKLEGESTSRSRSLLFIAGAISVASIIGKDVPVYIPENGFIGVNVPLTDSRAGSCSTRTTHPIFLNNLNEIFKEVGIKNSISNFYWDKTKGEILEEHKDNPMFNLKAKETLSCSHPCLSRYDRKKSDRIVTPCNCGYCFPCLIRRASFIKIGVDETEYNHLYELGSEFIYDYNNLQGRASDLKALLFSIKRYIENRDDSDYIRALLLRQGNLENVELDGYERVYRASMEELITMIHQIDNGLLDYVGIKGAEVSG